LGDSSLPAMPVLSSITTVIFWASRAVISIKPESTERSLPSSTMALSAGSNPKDWLNKTLFFEPFIPPCSAATNDPHNGRGINKG
jgi:hypothetical protein